MHTLCCPVPGGQQACAARQARDRAGQRTASFHPLYNSAASRSRTRRKRRCAPPSIPLASAPPRARGVAPAGGQAGVPVDGARPPPAGGETGSDHAAPPAPLRLPLRARGPRPGPRPRAGGLPLLALPALLLTWSSLTSQLPTPSLAPAAVLARLSLQVPSSLPPSLLAALSPDSSATTCAGRRRGGGGAGPHVARPPPAAAVTAAPGRAMMIAARGCRTVLGCQLPDESGLAWPCCCVVCCRPPGMNAAIGGGANTELPALAGTAGSEVAGSASGSLSLSSTRASLPPRRR